MADGFDECHKKGLSASPGVRDPLARSLAVAHEGAAQEGGAPLFLFQYLHPSDPDVNHADLLTSPLIVCRFLGGSFFFSSPVSFYHIVSFLGLLLL